jgi:hypothetical protein
MEKCYVTDELVEFLNLKPNTLYKESTIRRTIQNKKLNHKDIGEKFPGYTMCCCGKCSVSKTEFFKYIKSNCIIQSLKPNNFCYEYNQEPVKLSTINFDI